MAKKNQKNNTTCATSTFNNPKTLDQTFAAFKAAKAEYEAAQQAVAKQIVEYLEVNRGQKILCRDIANATGMTPQFIGSMIYCIKESRKITVTTATIVNTFMQVDENGQLIKNGKRRKVKQKVRAYTIK